MKTLFNLFISTLLLCIVACNGNVAKQKEEASVEKEIKKEAQAAPNTLTEKEKKNGWFLLFDGKTADGWRGFKKDAFPEFGWKVVDGALMVKYSGKGEEGHGGDIITEKQYDNFHLKVDWKISPGGNSGILYLVNESEDYEAIWHTAPEMQVIDGFGYGYHHDYILNIRQISGALYDLYPPKKAMAKEVGKWNHAELIIKGNKVEHWLNGVMVVKYELTSEDLKKRISKSKFAKYDAFLKAKKGHIGLQDHGEQVWYRNIKIKPM